MAISEQKYLKRKRYGRFAKEVLKALGTGLALFFILSSPQGTKRLLMGVKKEWNRRNTRETLKRLEERRLVAFNELPDGAIHVLLTDEGENKVAQWQFEDLKIKPQKRWDERWRIVAFDISEKRKKAREALRGMLKQFGFYQLQKSIFVYPYPCEAEIELSRKFFNIYKSELLYFSTDFIPCDLLLRKKFKLAK